MYLKSIRIKDFKGIEEKTFYFNDNFNVIIGENAVGKTSLLEAITIGLGAFMKGLYYVNGRSILKDDIRILSYQSNIVRAMESQIDLIAEINREEYTWTRKRQSHAYLKDLELYRNVFDLGQKLAKESKSGRFITLPLISFYGTGRLLKENDSKFNPANTEYRIDGYNKALNPNSNYKTLLSWFKETEISVYKSGKGIDALKSVKRAVRNSFDEIETLYYDERIDALSIILKENGKGIKAESKPLSTLSDGQKVLIGLMGDIALRCNLLNPLAEENANDMTPGIVLIDELDLHLHPNWQRKIVSILKETFPKIQFIVTTHSPFIIQSLKNEELIDLQEKELDTDYFNKSIEEISIEEMGVDTRRSLQFQKMMNLAYLYFKKINEPISTENTIEIQQLKSELNSFEEMFNEDPGFVALLKIEREIKGL